MPGMKTAPTMITVEEIRRINLRRLIEETKEYDDARAGTATALALKCKTSASYLSQILTRVPLESGKCRELGTSLARKLEKGCKKPEGWMDTLEHGDKVDKGANELANIYLTLDDKMKAALLQQAKLILQISKR